MKECFDSCIAMWVLGHYKHYHEPLSRKEMMFITDLRIKATKYLCELGEQNED